MKANTTPVMNKICNKMLSLMKVITASVMKVIRALTEGPYYMQGGPYYMLFLSFLSHLTIAPTAIRSHLS